MKILFDHQIFERQKQGGVSRYFADLISNLDIEVETSEMYVDNRYVNELNRPGIHYYKSNIIDQSKFLSGLNFRGKGKLYSLYAKFRGEHNSLGENRANALKTIKAGQFDLFHPTYYDPYFLNYIGDKPFVLTVYDMIHEVFTENLMNDYIIAKYKRLLIDKATHIIAISEQTKRDLCSIYDVEPNKVSVVYLSSGLDLQKSEPVTLPSEYLLHVGTRGGYKNFYFLCHALLPIFKQYPGLKLVAAGGGEFTAEEKKFLATLNIQEKVVQIPVTDPQLVTCYKNAIAHICPSAYEGFGLTVLEAMLCGCPVITSNAASLPEVAGDAAVYFSPKQVDQLQAAVNQLLENQNLRSELIAKGVARAAKFSLEATIDGTKSVYQKVLNK